MIKFYKIVNGELVSGSGKSLPDDTYNTDWSKLETKEDGSFYDRYNEDGTKDEVGQQEIDDAKAKEEAKIAKEETLSKLTVTLEIGRVLVFYADNEARQDLADAVLHSAPGETTPWKLAEEFEGNRIVVVTHEELKEASMLALRTKGQLVGAV